MTPDSWSWAMMTYEGSDEKELLFCRAVFNDSPGRVRIESQLGVGQDGKSKGEKINFGLMPGGGKEEQYIALPVVRWIDPAIRNPEKTIRYRGGDRAMVFENEEAFSRARVVHRSRLMRDNEEALAVMRDSNLYDPSMETLLMDPDAPILDGPGPGPGEKARLARYRDDEVVVEARLDSPGYLVLSDHFYPGWRAFDDKGGELRIYRTDMAMRAVHLPQGDHTVTFRYLPVDFRIGLFVTVFTILSWMAVCVGRAAFPKPVDTGKNKR